MRTIAGNHIGTVSSIPQPVPNRRRIYSHSQLYGNNNPFDRSSGSGVMTIKILAIAVASAIPAFFLGTTVSLFLSLENKCNCDTASHAAAGAVQYLSNVQQLQRPKELPPWVEEVVHERFQTHWQSLAGEQKQAQHQQQPEADDKEDEKRPDQLPEWVEDVVQERIDEERERLAAHVVEGQKRLRATQDTQATPFQLDPIRLGNYVRGMATTPKENFTSLLDLGVPLDSSRPGSTDVLMIYNNEYVVPNTVVSSNSPGLVQVPASEAIAKCDYISVILTDHSDYKFRNQCMAIVPQYESFHIQRWGRLNPTTNNVESGFPLQLVPHSTKKKGRVEFRPPSEIQVAKTFDFLSLYMNNVKDVLAELGEVLHRIAVDNTVIVMVCNFGQSELLVNFACSAQARGFDTSNVIVFTTDQETDDLARGLGLSTYYDHRNFGNIPKEAAGVYGDPKFTAMMLAKVICVQLVSMLGYDLLFSDVDVIWFKNPLGFFQGPDSPVKDHEVIFQDDGSRTFRYAPWSANSGFYFVRNTGRTRNFLTSLLLRATEVLSTNSHQKALVALLSEHVTLYGLKAKVISKNDPELPGGYHFNQKSGQFMKDLFSGKVEPYIFHMSWTESKNNKLKYFRQIGEWYVQDACIQAKAENIAGFQDNSAQACCSREPLFSCHYRDKPSKFPCPDSPNIDKGRRPSFWP